MSKTAAKINVNEFIRLPGGFFRVKEVEKFFSSGFVRIVTVIETITLPLNASVTVR